MPLAAELITRAVIAGPSRVFQDAAIGALSNAANGGSLSSSLEVARSTAGSAVEKINKDISGFACGTVRTALENTPVIGPVFRLGEAALGRRLCDDKDMTPAARKDMGLGAAADLISPGASIVLSAVKFGASEQARPVLESISSGITQSAGYKAYASVLGSDEPERTAPTATSTPSPADASAPTAVPESTVPTASRFEAPAPTPSLKSASEPASSDTEAAPAFASQVSISSKLEARRAAAAAAQALDLINSDPDQPAPIRSSPAFGVRM